MDQETQEIIKKTNQVVYRQFPYLTNVSPEVGSQGEKDTLLVYKGCASTADGHSLPVSVRVVIDSEGKILKISSSR